MAEAIFAADSRAVAEPLALFQSRAWRRSLRPIVAMLSIDDLLASLGLDTGERLGAGTASKRLIRTKSGTSIARRRRSSGCCWATHTICCRS